MGILGIMVVLTSYRSACNTTCGTGVVFMNRTCIGCVGTCSGSANASVPCSVGMIKCHELLSGRMTYFTLQASPPIGGSECTEHSIDSFVLNSYTRFATSVPGVLGPTVVIAAVMVLWLETGLVW